MLICQTCLRRYLRNLISIHSRTFSSASSATTTAAQSFSENLAAGADTNNEDGFLNSRLGASGASSGLLEFQLPSWQMKKHGPYKRGGISGGRARIIGRCRAGAGFWNSGKASKALSGNHNISSCDIKDLRMLLIQTQEMLELNDLDGAHELIAQLSSKFDTVEAWNKLIDYSLKNGSVAKGLKIYNDMKQRGMSPDSFTYMHVLKGLANAPSPTTHILSQALKIYEQLQSNNDGVIPTIVHTNNMLGVCLNVGDMERAWNILLNHPQGGGWDAPDAATFTIFLRGLRNRAKALVDAVDRRKGGEPDVSGFIQDGRRAWARALSRWQSGLLRIDEYLINAYLELLQISPSPSAHQEVFTVASQFYFTPSPKQQPNKFSISTSTLSPSDDIIPSKSVFRGVLYPDEYTLGALLKSAERLGSYELAFASWQTLTAPPHCVRITPITLQLYLRCMSISRRGDAAVELIISSHLPLTEWNYVMALKSCVDSGSAKSSYSNAAAILDHAEDTYPDTIGLMSLRTFLLVALDTCNEIVIKRAAMRIEKHLRPAALLHWKTLQRTESEASLSRETDNVIKKFLLTLKKAVFGNRIKWRRYQLERWTEKVRQTRAILKNDGVKCLHEAEANIKNERLEHTRIIDRESIHEIRLDSQNTTQIESQNKTQSKFQPELPKPDITEEQEYQNKKLMQVMVELQQFSQVERKFISNLKK